MKEHEEKGQPVQGCQMQAVPGNVPLDALGAVGISKRLLDDDLTLLWANDRYFCATGYSRAEYMARFPSAQQYYTDGEAGVQTLRRAVADARKMGADNVRCTLRMPLNGGGFRWVRVDGTITEEIVDGCRVLLSVVTDVDELVRRNRLCDQKMQYFEWMMEEYVGNIYISDMETYELLYLNRASCETLGRRQEDMLGRKCYEVIQGRTSPCPFCTNDRLTEDAFYEWEFYNPVLERTFMIKNRIVDWKGRRSRIELSHDMFSTEYKLAKKDREREAILSSIPGGFARLDARDRSTVLWYGARFLELIGYTQEQFENELHSQCSYVHPEDMVRAISVMDDIQESGQSALLEMRIITHDGETKLLTMTLHYIGGEDSWDGIPSFYSVGIDVTRERAELERQRRALEDAYQTARVASAAKTNFLSTMSHDIRTPMNAIMGMAAIAQANLASPERVRDCLNKINVSSRHLLSLINEVLDMSRIESGKIDLVPEAVDLSELIENVANMCKPLVEEKKQELKIHVGQVKHEQIVADGDRLQQVFMNLLSNAVKYTPEGGLISMVINELPSLTPDRGRYEFVFTDNGIGMREDFIPHIFEPFSRAEDSRISKVQGTGLGMAIAENIVQMMNGSILVKSELGKGSQFTVSIPLELQQGEELHEEELAGLPVLVVDDDQMVCENAAMLLDELGMRGFWVLSGAEAVARVQAAHDQRDDFFAVILDWKMPGMDGLETLRAIRGQLREDVPIIIISAYDYSSIEEEFIRAGADAFITKPLFKSKMLHVLQLFLENGSLQASGAQPDEPEHSLLGKRILLAEDNELNREIAVELLQMQGIVVEAAENGAEAVEMFRASAPGYYTAILMDIQMPVMNGYEATSAIRSLDRADAREIPILALTANVFVSDIGQAQSCGMNDHIAKPINVERLIEVLQKWIGTSNEAEKC